jgi:hypothetical protein
LPGEESGKLLGSKFSRLLQLMSFANRQSAAKQCKFFAAMELLA